MSNATQETIAWATKATAIRNDILANRIMSLDDPRARQISESQHDGTASVMEYIGDDDHTLEQIYFQQFAELPPQPLPMPAWADEVQVLLGSWPEVEIRFSRTVAVPEIGVTIEMAALHALFAEALQDNNAERWSVGDVSFEDKPTVDIAAAKRGLELPFTGTGDLRKVGEAILELAKLVDEVPVELHRATEPGAPSFEEVV